MLNQSFRQVFVTNNPVLPASGTTVDLAVGQVGIFDGKTYQATAAPTYAANKAISIWYGMPDVPSFLMAGLPQTNQSSKLIKGKLLKKLRRKSASRGQNQVVAIGFDGVDTSKNLTAKCGDVRTVYVKLTGNPIDKLHSEQGWLRQYRLETGCCDECGGDSCEDVNPSVLADKLVEQINGDPYWNAGGGQLIRAKKVLSTSPSTVGATAYNVYNLIIADDGDIASLSAVQVQYPTYKVTRVNRSGIISTYQLIKTGGAPASFTNEGLFIIADCGNCPGGYTLVANKFVYLVRKADAGDAAAQTAVATQYGIAGSETIARIAYKYGQSTYIIQSTTAVSPVSAANEVQSVIATGASNGNFTLTFDGETTANIAYNANAAAVQSALEALSNINPGDVTVAGGPLPSTAVTITFGGQYANTNVPQMTANSGGLTGGTAVVSTTTGGTTSAGSFELLMDNQSSRCVITSPTTTDWSDVGDLYAFPKVFHITLQDTVCGTNRLAELQAAYPDLVVTQLSDGPVSCIHQYETTIYSDPVAVGCSVDQIKFPALPAFQGISWTPVTSTPTDVTNAGVIIETAFVNRITGDCTYDYWPYEADTVHIEISEYNADYNASPCESRWPVSELQSVKYPQGVGSYVREQEKKSLSYFLIERSNDPAVREAEGFSFQTDPHKYYDEFTLEFDFKYKVGGYSTEYQDSYHLAIYVPEGSGAALQQALVTYAESIGNDVEIDLQ
jgi:hypothetical protein